MPVYRRVLDRFLDDLDRILVTSPRLRDSSPHLGQYIEKCEVVPLSIDLSKYSQGVPEPNEFPVDAAEPYILCVGRLNYYKGVEYLIRAIAGIDAPLVVVGDGPRYNALTSLVEDLKLESQVHFLGHVDRTMLQYCYEHADVFVLPSVEPSEAFGVVQLEAMAYETPVVNTSLRTGVPWVSISEETGLTVPPRDADALADAIGRLLASEDERETFGRAARKRVEERFREREMLDTIEQIYRDLTG
jgi:rhamnosyl/mannosyltransferase